MKRTYVNNIFVNKLPLDVKDEEVRQAFAQAGKIIVFNLIQKPNKNYKCAKILYDDTSSA
jgi:RNA recognition motif-containing protein